MAEIDLTAVESNVQAIRSVIGDTRFCAVVKADGYGHGDVPVGNAALRGGASVLAVALVEEGIRLREAGIDAQVLLLSEPQPTDAKAVAQWKLTPTVYTAEFVEAWSATGARSPVHVKVDTGMHRVGVKPSDLEALLATLARSGMEVEAFWSHFAVADEDDAFTREQMQRFDEAVAQFDPGHVHLANTAGALLHEASRREMVRVGLGIYGLHPSKRTETVVELEPAMRVSTRVSHVATHPAGARPSYGRVRSLDGPSTVATVPIGYADGFRRGLSADGAALIRGKRYPLAGMVTMDQIMIDLGSDDVEIGEEVVVMGSQGETAIRVEEWAGQLDTITYEVVTGIGARVPRAYS